MSITHEDIVLLKKEFDDRYVQIADCDNVQQENNKKFANDKEQISLILVEQNHIREEMKKGFKINNWLTTAVLGVIIAGVIGYIFLNFGG